MTVTATPVSSAASSANSSSSSSSSATSAGGLADNFQTFLTLLTTQLQNQNPLDPLDTNQFTSQLVQFASVEQQLKTNDSLSSLVSLQKATQSTQALAFVGQTVTLNGSTAPLSNSSATWNLNSASGGASATVNIVGSNGQTVYSGTGTLNKGANSFTWDGKGNDGTQWPDGNYTMNVTAKDSNGTAVTVTTSMQGVVNSVDLTADPPLLSVGGHTYTVSQVQSVGTQQ